MKNVIQESKYKRKYSYSEVIRGKEFIFGTNVYKCHWKHSQSKLTASNQTVCIILKHGIRWNNSFDLGGKL